jgi:hypothetical protein
MTDLRVVLPPPGRTNTTLLHDLHPDDHNVIVDAINGVDVALAAAVAAGHYRIYFSLAERDADTAARVDGTLAWAAVEGVLAVWRVEAWLTLFEPLIDFEPHLWIGTAEFDNVIPVATPPYRSRYRHEFGVCRFWIAARFGSLGAGATGTLAIQAPLPPAVYTVTIVTPEETFTDEVSSGAFGTAYAVTGDHGAIGGIGGVYDGTVTLLGASGAGQLAIVMPDTGGLMDDTDMGGGASSIVGGNPGEFDVFMAGAYQTDVYF